MAKKTTQHEEVMFQLGKISASQEALDKDIIELKDDHVLPMRKDVASLNRKVAIVETKSGLWGTVGGFIAVSIYQLKIFFGYH